MFDESLIIEYFEKIRNIKLKWVEREIKVEEIENKAVSIIGPRRSGKTYFLLKKFLDEKDASIYMDFESIEFSKIEPKEVLKIIPLYEAKFSLKVEKIFLDEIQNLENWNSLVRSLLNKNYKVFLSGSSSKLLPKELATSLRGKTISYLLLPFSFREFLISRNFSFAKILSVSEIQKIKNYLEEYLTYGAYPEVIFSESKERILKEYFETIFYKDFVERHKIKSLDTAKVIFEYLFQNYSKEVSIEKIRKFIENTLKIKTKTTIYSYIDKISDTFSVFFVDKFSQSVYLRRSWPKKVYVCDVGISTVLGFSKDIGKKMENVVFLELLRKTNEKPLMEIYYFKDYQQNEVDFVIKEGLNVKQLIQVTYANNKDEIEKREIKTLLKASKLLKCKDLLIITWDFEDEIRIGNKVIKYLPLWKWFLKFF